MLTHLSIRNYALIERLDMDFFPGLSTITGETGAGKSILLGALDLIQGARADTTAIQQGASSCIVEAEFDISTYGWRHSSKRKISISSRAPSYGGSSPTAANRGLSSTTFLSILKPSATSHPTYSTSIRSTRTSYFKTPIFSSMC